MTSQPRAPLAPSVIRGVGASGGEVAVVRRVISHAASAEKRTTC